MSERREGPVLLFFYSKRSGQSRRAEGFLAQVLQRRHNHEAFDIRRVDADLEPDLGKRFGVEVLPTMVVIEDGRICARLEQPRGCAEIQTALAPWLQ
jgi:thioredoxin-like negative regulator of GroEL